MSKLLPFDGESIDISEVVELVAPAIYNPSHEHDSFRKGQTWATVVEGVPGIFSKDYENDVNRTRWLAETVIVTAWDRLRDHFYAEYEENK